MTLGKVPIMFYVCISWGVGLRPVPLACALRHAHHTSVATRKNTAVLDDLRGLKGNMIKYLCFSPFFLAF